MPTLGRALFCVPFVLFLRLFIFSSSSLVAPCNCFCFFSRVFTPVPAEGDLVTEVALEFGTDLVALVVGRVLLATVGFSSCFSASIFYAKASSHLLQHVFIRPFCVWQGLWFWAESRNFILHLINLAHHKLHFHCLTFSAWKCIQQKIFCSWFWTLSETS